MRMTRAWVCRWGILTVLAGVAAGCATISLPLISRSGKKTALDTYVHQPDSTYAWKVAKTVKTDGATTFILDLTSQTWRTAPEVSNPVWKHWLIVVKPDVVEHDKALLYIAGGNNRDANPPNGIDPIWGRTANLTKSVIAELRMIPNQPLEFNGDGKGRSEDDLIAYTWDKVMRTGDLTWSARMPMVKASVRAMDAIQEFLASEEGGRVPVKNFVVCGGSKRGWTTWLTGAVDPRVCAMIPAVIDILNVQTSMKHHYGAYGFWAPAVGDYVRHGITNWMDTPEYQMLLDMEDPYSYRQRLKMPKYIVNSSGDEFFVPDSAQFYYHDLVGEKYLRVVPNTKHSLQGSDARDSIVAYYNAILTGRERPKFTWKIEDDGAIRVQTNDKPLHVNLWQATNPNARDFRLDTIGKAYTSTPVEAAGDGAYVARVPVPEKGWTAYFVELVYDSGLEQAPFKFTTQVKVTPDVLPFKDMPIPVTDPKK